MAEKQYRPKSGNEGMVLTIANGDEPLEIKDWPYTPEDAGVAALLANHDLVTGGDFRGAMFTFGPAELPGRFVYYLGYLSEQFHPGFLAVALLGVAYLLAKDRAALALLGSLYLGWTSPT